MCVHNNEKVDNYQSQYNDQQQTLEKKSDGSNALKIKNRESEEMECKNQFQSQDCIPLMSLIKVVYLTPKSFIIIEQMTAIEILKEFKIKLDYEQPIPLIQLIEHEIRLRFRPDLAKQTKCVGDLSEQVIVDVKSTAENDFDKDINEQTI
ncbi:unnamed protein product (macronuclear) [Paramecium tetraurelia]|uniref:Uncharacterized protein n=1 Tax=Paramecium tetraurelia TaxID=5888 RepID=A0CBR2_PARTE|nr:uncharacterized protein GSPATT00037012001 [Paramecium tetraurelia]CAK68229.1 unnamed protein product [Paramecium tetraurelia]|eukprot:XP_001435626.1 hypothetical protein (macronuclear) [Paramecium tetraurelia strain d4-2]